MKGWYKRREKMEYSRGSEWRRWDLHIHTPETLKEDRFIVANGEDKWQKYFATILSYVGDMSDPQKAVSAIGITDYFSIENYKKVVANPSITSKIPLILPNVELRVTPAANDALVNLHCIFNPALGIAEIERRFLGELKFKRNGIPYSASEAGLISLGNAIEPKTKNTASQNNDIWAKQVAVKEFAIPFEDVRKLFEGDIELRNNTIIVVSNKSGDGASGLRDMKTLQSEVYKLADAIFSAMPNDILHFLGKGVDSPQKIKDACGKLMACIHGSDAHSFDKIFEPAEKRYCWIKADCTFEGLKQIMYEPEDRVRICEARPEQKNDYQVIDKVIISHADFQQEEIVFNQNLTCIIGGRSTGKSNLLRNIANIIDPKQVSEKSEKVNSKLPPWIIQGLSVYWKDDDKSPNIKRKITYIPQTYLNRLSDDHEKKTEIDEMIESIIIKDDEIRKMNEALRERVRTVKATISKQVSDLFSKEESLQELQRQIDELGKEDVIDKQLKKLQAQRDAIAKENKLSDADITTYGNAKARILEIDNELATLRNDQDAIEVMKSLVYRANIQNRISVVYKDIIEREAEAAVAEADVKWAKKKVALLGEINAVIQKKVAERKTIEETLKVLEPKIVNSATMNNLTVQIDSEAKKLSQVKELSAREKKQRAEKAGMLEKLISLSSEFKTEYESYASRLTKRFKDTGRTFNVNAFYRTEDFLKGFGGIFNKAILKAHKIDEEEIRTNGLANQHYNFDDGAKLKFIKDIFEMPKAVKANLSKEDAVKTVLADYYNISYGATVENDDQISQMSPGRKALLLLKLLIELDDSTNPILIDQPEDDLDNRSIFEDLVKFIKEKKRQRQIILVTHNANIAIGCDTEEIIIANQDGKDSENHSKKFEYRSGSIESNVPRFDNQGRIVKGVLNQTGIQHQACNILEGGKEAFDIRNNKYVR
jgi:ABC-type cobalamin/Fe3+-siderophores transport system ATPase subunit